MWCTRSDLDGWINETQSSVKGRVGVLGVVAETENRPSEDPDEPRCSKLSETGIVESRGVIKRTLVGTLVWCRPLRDCKDFSEDL